MDALTVYGAVAVTLLMIAYTRWSREPRCLVSSSRAPVSPRQAMRNGVRPRRLQTGEGELVVEVPQLRATAARFVCRTIPGTRTVIRTRPLEALVIGAYVRGLSDRDPESLLAEAGLGRLSRSSASRVCQELRDR